MKTVFAGVEQISSQQMLYALIILCLLLVILMLIAVFVQNKRAKVAEGQAKNMTLFVQERLDLAAKHAEQSDKTAREELGAAMQSVRHNDANDGRNDAHPTGTDGYVRRTASRGGTSG